MKEKNCSSEKIKRGFVVHNDTFVKFKSAVAAKGYPNFSEVIEHLILCYLKDPDIFGDPRISC